MELPAPRYFGLSRSIHTTRRTLQVARCHDCADPERHAEFLAELEEESGTRMALEQLRGRLAGP